MTETKISDFSSRFAAALRGVMAENKVTLRAVADHMDRSIGFISERTGGQRPVDTDIIDAVADLCGLQTGELVMEIARRLNVSAAVAGRIEEDGNRFAETPDASGDADLA